MSEELNTGLDPINARLAAAFTESETTPETQVDNLTTETAETAETVEEPVEETPSETAEETPEGEEKADETEAKAGEPAADEDESADFKAIEDEEKEFLTDVAELKAKFPRNSSKELLAQTAEYAAEAKAGHELKKAIGGDHFVQPMTKIAQAIGTGEMAGLYDGIVEAAGTDTLMNILAQSVDLAFVQGEKFAANPETAEFGKALGSLVDRAIEQKFGEGMTIDALSQMAQWKSLGWFDKIASWIENNDIPYDEAQDLLEASNDPKYAELLREKDELKKQLEAKATQEKSAVAIEHSKVEKQFSTSVTEGVDKILNDVVWKTSILRDISTDNAELKAEKAMLRQQLRTGALEAFDSDTRSALLNDYKQGKQGTAAFKAKMATAIEAAVLKTKQSTVTAEKLIAKAYGSVRNAQLAPKQTTQKPVLTPTAPSLIPPSEVKSPADVQRNLEEAFKAFG